MNRIFTLTLLLSLLPFALAHAQLVPDGQAARMTDTPRGPKKLSAARALESTITCASCYYQPGYTFSLLLNYNHSSPDEEWVDGIYLAFPDGVTVNAASNIVQGAQRLDWNGEAGTAALVTWGDTIGGTEEGPLYINAQFSVDITVEPDFSGALEISYKIIGDGWGAPPHFSAGTIVLEAGGIIDLAAIQINTNYPNPNFAHQGIPLSARVSVMNAGFFPMDSFVVTLSDGHGYLEVVAVNAVLPPGQQRSIAFPCWAPSVVGGNQLTATVQAPGDENPANDSFAAPFNVYALPATGPPPGQPRGIAEFEASIGALVRARPSGQFDVPYTLLAEIARDATLYIVCNGQQQANAITPALVGNGVDMANVEFIFSPSNSPWTRDYGPWLVEYGDRAAGVINFPYNRPRPQDNQVPIATASYLGLEHFNLPLLHTGGNYMINGYGIAASDDLTYHENDCLTEPELLAHSEAYLGIHTYHLLDDPLNSWLQHIDTWAKFLGPDKIIVLQVPPSNSNYQDLEDMAAYFANQPGPYGRNFQVFRVFTPHNQPYANSLILNNKVLVPVNPDYGTSCYQGALASFREAMPGYEVIGFPFNAWWSQDALHCRAMQIADPELLRIVHQPYLDTLEYQPSYLFGALVYSLSAPQGWEETARLYFRLDGGDFQEVAMSAGPDGFFSAELSGLPPGSEVCYYLEAANNNGRLERHPYIGAPDPHCFVIGTSPVAVAEALPGFLNLYPNPTGDLLSLQLDGRLAGPCRLQLLNSGGAAVSEQEVYLPPTGEVLEVPVGHLPAGFYFVRLRHAQGSLVGRFVKR
jgi:agmatine/peptidylarginine deiminase